MTETRLTEASGDWIKVDASIYSPEDLICTYEIDFGESVFSETADEINSVYVLLNDSISRKHSEKELPFASGNEVAKVLDAHLTDIEPLTCKTEIYGFGNEFPQRLDQTWIEELPEDEQQVLNDWKAIYLVDGIFRIGGIPIWSGQMDEVSPDADNRKLAILSHAACLVDGEGEKLFYWNNPITVNKSVQKEKPVEPRQVLNEALQKLEGYNLRGEPVTVYEISLVYLAEKEQLEDTKGMLIPYWVVKYIYENSGEQAGFYFNALTGVSIVD